MKDTVIGAIQARFQSFADLASVVADETLSQQLPLAKNKSLQEHFWCLVGARESYTRAIEQDEWAGFSCSLQALDQVSILEGLRRSAETFAQTIPAMGDLSPKQAELLVALLEHEVMHEGQMIRQMYALGHDLPPSWRWA